MKTKPDKKDCEKKLKKLPVEKHETAAWADISETKPISKVTIPSSFHVENAKEYVDENQK